MFEVWGACRHTLARGWRATTDEDYFAACSRCEIRVVLAQNEYELVKANLAYDRRKFGLYRDGSTELDPGPGATKGFWPGAGMGTEEGVGRLA